MRMPLKAPCASAGRASTGVHHHGNIQCRPIGAPRSRAASSAVRDLTMHAGARSGPASDSVDVVLSSGFLAFAAHSGFLQAVDQIKVPVGGVMGTSAGALVGSLYCAGYTPSQVAKYLSDQAPASLLRPSVTPWRGGALSLDDVVARLRDLLPPRFEDLHKEFAVGVVTADGEHLLIDSGPLPEAVAASAAIPFLFQAVDVPGDVAELGPFKDGGVVDRVGLRAWRNRRRAQIQQQKRHYHNQVLGASSHKAGGTGVGSAVAPSRPPPCLVHVIDRSSPFSGDDDTDSMGESHIVVVNSPRAKANLFHLGSFEETMRHSCDRARERLLVKLHAKSSPLTVGGIKLSGGGSSSSINTSGGMPLGEVNGATRGSGSLPPKEAVARATIF